MNCPEAKTLVAAFVDRELDVATNLQMEAHLAGCSTCSAAVEQITALRAAIDAAPLIYPSPPELAGRLRAALRREAGPRRTGPRQDWRWAAVPALAVAAMALLWIVPAGRRPAADRQRLLDDLVAGHVRSLMADHLVDVASTDQHTVRPWFNGKIDFAPPVADHAASDFALVGGRLDYVGGRPVAALVYRHGPHVINLFIWPSNDDESAGREISSQGYHLLRWSDAGLEYWAVSDLNPGELENLAELIRPSHS